MEPIKPVEGILKDAEGQASVLAKVVRERYWQNQTSDVPAVEAGAETSTVVEKKQDQTEKETAATISRTYAEFQINRDTHEVTVRIIEAESGRLVRTIPTDELVKEIIKGNFQPNQLRRRAILV